MVKSETYTLTPITKAEFDMLHPRLTIYNEIIQDFLQSNEDIVEVTLNNITAKNAYATLKAHSKRHNYSFLVRRRENRIFLLKVKPTGEVKK